MGEPPSPTATTIAGMPPAEPGDEAVVVGADEQSDVAVDVDRWVALARAVLVSEGRRGELTLTFVDRDEIAALNAEHLGKDGPTDVLSFPLDDDAPQPGVPVLLGDVVVCPAVAAAQAATHAGTLDDELALLVVHGVLHVVGHDHAEPDETAAMRARELALLEAHHWGGPAPAAFRQEHSA
jgi:probable rRNA maturation factor